MWDKHNTNPGSDAADLNLWADKLRSARSRRERAVETAAGQMLSGGPEAEAQAASLDAAAPVAEQSRVPVPANDALADLADRLLVDETAPFYLAGLDGRLVRVNGAYRDLALRCGETGPAPGPPQPGAAVPDSHRGLLEEVAASGGAVTTDEWLLLEGRESCWRGRHFPVYNAAGELAAVAGQYSEVTADMVTRREAVRARQRFNDFARATSDWFWETDRDGRITLLSERLAACIGRPASAYYGAFLSDLVGEGRDPGMGEAIAEALRKRSAFRGLAFEIQGGDGSRRRFELAGVPAFDTQTGAFIGFRGAGMDVTESHEAAQRTLAVQSDLEETLEELTRKNLELDIASSQAESALKAKNDFLASMSHELRTPLNAIIGFAEAMQMQVFGPLNENYQKYSRDIVSAGQHLLNLINDVLDVSVLESEGVAIQREPLSSHHLVSQALSLVKMRASERGIALAPIAGQPDLSVYVDDRRATQILVNLLGNAIKFTPEGGRVGVEIARLSDMAAIGVWDTGVGIAPEQVEAVFDKFRQAGQSAYNRKDDGAGLGLHISRELARRMGGDITLQSQPGEGSRFTVTLPLADGAAGPDGAPTE